jgi:hypothetical protein
MLIKNHFRETEQLLRQISAEDVADWILNKGFFPEQYILPPSFRISEFKAMMEFKKMNYINPY